MPLVQITLARGRTAEQIAALGQAVTDAVESSIGARRESIRVTLNEVEAEHIRRTLRETFFNQSAAARLLGIDRKQLARKIRKFGLRVPRLSPGRPSER